MRFIPRTPEYLALRAERRRTARRKWVEANPTEMQRCRDRWRLNNLGRILENRRRRTRRLTGRCVIPRHSVSSYDKKAGARRRSTKWYHKHKLSPQLLIRNRLRARVMIALGKQGVSKSTKTVQLIGCSWEFLESHIERQFVAGMTWSNRGLWHVDHIRPCSSFDLTDVEQQRRCFNYSNLRPLWAKDNLSKGHKWKAAA